MALKIGLSSYVSAGFTNPVRWDLKEDVSGILIDTHSEAGPHGVVYNFDWSNNILDIAYRIEFYDVPGGVGIGNLIKSHVVTPSTQTIAFETDIELIVGGAETYDPVVGTIGVIIPALLGKDFYVQQRGIGQLRKIRSIEVTPNLVDGGFDLTGGVTFNEGDTFIIKIIPVIIVNPPGTQPSSNFYKAIEIITVDTVLTSLDFGKLLIVDGAAKIITLQLPLIADALSKVSLWIRSIGTTHNNIIIKAGIGETITATATTSQTFILGRGEDAEIILNDGIYYGFTDSNDIKRAGNLEWGYKIGLNRLWADGNASAPGAIDYLCADYPRVKKAMDLLEVGQVVTFAQWNSSVVINGITLYPYKGFFALSDDGLSFKVPDWRNKSIRALKDSNLTADAERLQQGAGGLQNEAIGPHRHFVANVHSDTTGEALDATKYLDAQGEVNGDFKYTLHGNSTAPTIGLTSTGNGGIETRGINIGMIPLIIT